MAWVAVCFRLGALPLEQPDEGRNAEVAREMKESGAWLAPTYNGIAYLDKPAFYFKAVALSLAMFGDSETAARIPSAVFGIGLLALVYFFCRREYGVRCAALAAIVLATTPLFLVNARTVIFDIALCFFVVSAIFAGYRAEESEGSARRNWYLLGAAAAGFATLVKGPVGFLIPILVLLVFNRVRGAARSLETPFCAAQPAGFLRRGAAVVHRAFAGAPGFSALRAGRGIVSPLHDDGISPFEARFIFTRIIVMGMFLPWSLLLPEGRSRGVEIPAELCHAPMSSASSGRWWWCFSSPAPNQKCRATS